MKTRTLTLGLIIMITTLFIPSMAKAQTAFKPGETLVYNLYFNWKFVWVNVGYATMTTQASHFNGLDAYKCSLNTKTNSKADKFFVMRDTLSCYVDHSMNPLKYRKAAHEGKRNYIDELTYSYGGGKTNVVMKARNSEGVTTTKRASFNNGVYDMLSIFLKARSFSTAGWKKGHTITFALADGDGSKTGKLRYMGKSTVKADNNKKYDCLELAYIEKDGGKEKEIVRFFVTDDSRHIPIRLDLNLKFGSAKAFLTTAKNI